MRMEKWEPWPDQTPVPLEDVPEHMNVKLTCPGGGKKGKDIIFLESDDPLRTTFPQMC